MENHSQEDHVTEAVSDEGDAASDERPLETIEEPAEAVAKEPEAPVAEEPVADEPEPAAEEPAVAEDAPADEPEPEGAAEELEEAAGDEVDEPEPVVAEDAPAEEPVAEEEPVAKEAPTEEPVAEEPVAKKPAAKKRAEPTEVSPELAAAVEEALEGAEGPEEGAVVLPPEIPGDWFVIHTYSGYENKVKSNLETRIISMNMEDKIYEVVIPTEDVVEMKSGKRQTVQRKVLPGYVLVRMDLDDDSWYVVRNTPNVTGFVGSANHPIPLSEPEVDRILRRKEEAERPKPRAEWSVNDSVRVTTGPFANFQGVVSEVDLERQKVKVLVNIFGRETPVELSFDQISKV